MIDHNYHLFTERDFEPEDADFVLASWLRSYMSSPIVRHIDKDVYYAGQNAIARRLLAESDVTMLVSAEEPDTIVAWIASRDQWIHYVYVKQSFRKMGLASRLVGGHGKWLGYTHKSQMCEKLKIPSHWVYNPYLQWVSD